MLNNNVIQFTHPTNFTKNYSKRNFINKKLKKIKF